MTRSPPRTHLQPLPTPVVGADAAALVALSDEPIPAASAAATDSISGGAITNAISRLSLEIGADRDAASNAMARA